MTTSELGKILKEIEEKSMKLNIRNFGRGHKIVKNNQIAAKYQFGQQEINHSVIPTNFFFPYF